MRNAQTLLQQVRATAAADNQTKLAAHLDKAIEQISTALKIR